MIRTYLNVAGIMAAGMLVAASVARADTDGTSTTTLKDKIVASYFGAYDGPKVNNAIGSTRPAVSSWNTLGVGYKTSMGFQVDAQAVFLADLSNQDLELLNPRLGISGTAVNTDRLMIWANLNSDLPLVLGDRGAQFTLGSFQEVNYKLGESKKLIIGGFNVARFKDYSSKNADGARSFIGGTAQPMVRYMVRSNVGLQLVNSLDYNLALSGDNKGMSTGANYIQPGANIEISKVVAMPYLSINTKEGMQDASIGMWLSVGIL